MFLLYIQRRGYNKITTITIFWTTFCLNSKIILIKTSRLSNCESDDCTSSIMTEGNHERIKHIDINNSENEDQPKTIHYQYLENI